MFDDIYEEFLEELKDNYKSFTIRYEGKGISLNDFYSQQHWSVRDKIVKKYKPMFRDLLTKELGSLELGQAERLDEFVLILEFWSRHDTDNIVGLEKVFMDALKQNDRKGKEQDGWVIDDHKKYYKFFGIKPNDSFKNNEFVFHLIKLK